MGEHLTSLRPAGVTDTGPIVVCADDEADIRNLVSFGLSQAGYRVVFASDGLEALRLALAMKPALLLLDVAMPGLDGYELTRRLRANEETKDIPIVLLTARAQPADVDAGYEAGADAYLKKPFTLVDLTQRVTDLIAGGGR